MAKVIIFAVLILAGLGFWGIKKFRTQVTPMPTPTVKIMTQEEKIGNLAKGELAEYLKTDKDKIEIVSVESVNWTDASLGAPEEGMFYAQVITSGFKVVLLANSIKYAAHTDDTGERVVLVKDEIRLK